MTKLLLDYGLVLLFAVVFLESAGLPFLPGEVALIAAAVLASRGHFSIVSVIVVTAVAAALGYGVAYWLGLRGGRRLLARWDVTSRYAGKTLPPAERFFRSHGSKTVFVGRFVAVLRATVGWLAGITGMHWWTFVGWNIAGAIAWATAYGLLAYYAGGALVDAISRYSAYAVAVLVVLAIGGFFVHRAVQRRLEQS
ncbi:MAG TPA: DedA family protein [Gaiellaceae bacterium]